MTLRLSRRRRALLSFLSAGAYAAWLSGLADRLDAQDLQRPNVPALSAPASSRRPPLATLVVRNPFEDDGAERRPDERGAAPHSAALGAVAASRSDASDASDVPDIRSDSQAQAPPAMTSLAVQATIAGPNPVAYVSCAGTMEVVRVGDTLAGRTIAKIDLRGLTFVDGRRLDLPDFVATPAPARARGGAAAASLDDLRRLLQRPASPARGDGAATAATSSPAAAATADAYPTPGALPTVDRGGFAPGVRPSPDASAPTPFPYPYPYAPAAR